MDVHPNIDPALVAVPLMARASHGANVAECVPDSAHLEAARVLADQASAALTARGFNDEEIRDWAETYLAHESSGDLDSFLAWILDAEAAETTT